MKSVDRSPIPEQESNIIYEAAEAIIEAERPNYLQKLETEEQARNRREYNFHFIAGKLSEQGNTLPISKAHADTGEGLAEMVTKPLSEWRQYWLEAVSAQAGFDV